MKIRELSLLLLIIASPLIAQEHREVGAHEHGVGQLDVAIDGNRVAVIFHAPGADIVGFEYPAQSAEDRAAVDDALAVLARALNLFALPKAAGCLVTDARADTVTESDDDRAAHDEHGAKHTEFVAEYDLTCSNAGAIDRINFAYFDTFSNARELNVQIISNNGAKGFKIKRNAPLLNLPGRM